MQSSGMRVVICAYLRVFGVVVFGVEHVRPLRGRMCGVQDSLTSSDQPPPNLKPLLAQRGGGLQPVHTCGGFWVVTGSGRASSAPVTPEVTPYVRLPGRCRNESVARGLRATHACAKRDPSNSVAFSGLSHRAEPARPLRGTCDIAP